MSRRYRTARALVLSVLLLVWGMLAACGAGGSEDVPVVPTAPDELAAGTDPSTEQPLPTGAAQREILPGRLLFVQNGTIWLWQGEQPRPLTALAQAWQPAWSPDGTRIAYVQRGQSYSDIRLASASGEPMARVTSNSSTFAPRSHERIFDSMWAFYPAWSPDGDTLAVATQYGPPMPSPSGAVEYNLSLYALPVGGGTRQQLYADNEAHVGPMAYAPGGRWLVFTRSGFSTNSSQQLYRLALNTEQAAPYPGAPMRSYDPAFSPDGRWLAFAARDNDQTDIWVLPGTAPPGSSPNPQRLTSMGMARAPAFSPDGRLLAFLAIPPDEQGFELWVSELSQPVDGVLQASDPRQLTSEMGLDADSGLSWAR